MTITTIFALVSPSLILIGVVASVLKSVHNIKEGNKCLLRNDMLHIYYRHQADKQLRQYEYENFMYLYGAYKALKGNSFADKIKNEIEEWKVNS